MASISTNLTVTIVTATTPEGEEDLLLEAEIVEDDNGGVSTYYVGTTYFLRLFKSTTVSSLVKNSNIGTVALNSAGLTTTVPYDEDDPEYLTFTGSNTASLSKVYESGFSYTVIGAAFDNEGVETTITLSPPAKGEKTVTANKECYGVFNVSYVTKYDKYSFMSPVTGQMLIFFIGSDT